MEGVYTARIPVVTNQESLNLSFWSKQMEMVPNQVALCHYMCVGVCPHSVRPPPPDRFARNARLDFRMFRCHQTLLNVTSFHLALKETKKKERNWNPCNLVISTISHSFQFKPTLVKSFKRIQRKKTNNPFSSFPQSDTRFATEFQLHLQKKPQKSTTHKWVMRHVQMSRDLQSSTSIDINHWRWRSCCAAALQLCEAISGTACCLGP